MLWTCWGVGNEWREIQNPLGLPYQEMSPDGGLHIQWLLKLLSSKKLLISAVLAEDHSNWHKLLTDEEFREIEALCTVFKTFFLHYRCTLWWKKCYGISSTTSLWSTYCSWCGKDSDSRFIKEVKQKVNNDITNWWWQHPVTFGQSCLSWSEVQEMSVRLWWYSWDDTRRGFGRSCSGRTKQWNNSTAKKM